MKDILKRILVLPTWLLAGILYPFLPETHIWKGKPFFTLKAWANGSTYLNTAISTIYWITIPIGIYAIHLIWAIPR